MDTDSKTEQTAVTEAVKEAGKEAPPQTVDLATKLVEQGAQSVKQALNTQL